MENEQIKTEFNETEREQLIGCLVDELPVLRTKLGVSQTEIANMIGVSRQTYSSIETRKRKMTWSIYLSLILVFDCNSKTHDYIRGRGLFPKEIIISTEVTPLNLNNSFAKLENRTIRFDEMAIQKIETVFLSEYVRCNKTERQIENTQFKLKDMWLFRNEKKCLFLNRSGHILITDMELGLQVINNNCTEDLLLKLLQRGFAAEMAEEKSDEETEADDIRPMFFMIDMTNRCNMSCKYCLREINDQPGEESITYEMLRKICEYIASYCRDIEDDRITIQPWGGEPLLEKDKIFFIKNELQRYGIKPTITIETNGLLLSDELIKELRENEIGISVSIDGNEQVHDSQRVLANGRKTHHLIKRRIQSFREITGENVSTISTITRNSLEHIEDIRTNGTAKDFLMLFK